MAERKDRYALIGTFEKMCKMNDTVHQPINKHSEQWTADALLESFDRDSLYKAMEYFFIVNKFPTWKAFANNADRLLQSLKAKQQDEEFRAEMRQKAKEWLSESRG